MIIRIVKLTFHPENIPTFLETFKLQKAHIAKFDGCTHVSLLRDVRDPNVFFTYSHWNEESDLEAYRVSPFFQDIWKKVKPLFSDKPKAWSTIEFPPKED